MRISSIAFEKLKEFEGLRLEAYRDAGGTLTIGYGHTGKEIRPGDRISRYWAEEMLRADVERVERQVAALGVARTQGQRDALVSFAFNLGIGSLKRSGLLKVIRRRSSRNEIRREFKRWVYVRGKRMPGLESRREWEANRFFE
jgi:lysozyme